MAEPTSHDPLEDVSPAPSPGIWRGWVRPLLVVLLVVTALRSSLLDWNDVPSGSMIPTIAVGDRIVVNKLAYGFNIPFNGPTVSIPFTTRMFANPLDGLPGFYFASPGRNDIVTFWKPGEMEADGGGGGIRMIKRVVAVPGDVVSMRPAILTHNGQPHHISALTINGETAEYALIGGGSSPRIVETLLGDRRDVQYMRNVMVPHPQTGRPVPFPVQPAAVEFGPVTLGEGEYLMIGDNRDNSTDGRFFGPVELEQITGKAKFVAVSFRDGDYRRPAWERFFQGME